MNFPTITMLKMPLRHNLNSKAKARLLVTRSKKKFRLQTLKYNELILFMVQMGLQE